MDLIVLLALTYLIAAVPFGLVLTTLAGGDVDIREAGSGNPGATNVARLYGWRLGLQVLLLDLLKGFVPVKLALWLWPDAGLLGAGLVGVTAFLAHCFPIYLAFRGGKGVATAGGVLLALAPVPALFATGVWAVVLKLTGRGSVASLAAAVTVLVAVTAWALPVLPVAILLGLGVFATHTPNIRRLAAGEERPVVEGVRWGRARENLTAEDVLAQGPSGRLGGPPER